MAEILTEVKGKLIADPPKTRAGRRTVGPPPFVVRELEAQLAAAQRPTATPSPPPVGAAAGPELSGALWVPATKAAGLQGLRILDLRHTAMRAAPTPVSFTLDRYGHQTIPGPVAKGRCHPVGD